MSNCKVIALTNQKGGVGKTTTAVNLGVCLSKQGKKVLLVDADAQANLTMSLGYPRPDDLPISLATIMQDIIDDKLFDVQKGILHHSEGVDLLPSNIELSGLEVRLINAISRERVLTTCINEVKKNYDYVLIDCMPSLGMLTINALAAADSVVIPTQPHYLSAKGLELLLRSVSKVRRQINPHLRIDGILMTMVMPRTNISKEVTALVRSAYGQNIKVFDAQIPHSIRAVEATAEGKEDGRYELISGHRRKKACELAGLDTLKCEVKEFSRDEAIIVMVESNLQRTTILPSEKAFAYKMRLEAMNRQGKRTDLTCSPMGNKLQGKKSSDELAEKVGESKNQIFRYIRLTELVPEILQMVDERQIAFRPAVEISYLSEEQQYTLLEAMEYNDATPSLAQAIKMKKYMQEGKLTDGVISSIMEEEKPNQREKPAFRDERITKLIPKSVPKGKESDFVVKALPLRVRTTEQRQGLRNSIICQS